MVPERNSSLTRALRSCRAVFGARRSGFWRAVAVVATLCPGATAAAPVITPKILERRPHDPSAFTQGLVLDGTTLYESTGLYGASTLRRVDPVTGAVLASRSLPETEFAEGLAKAGDRLIQLTWKNGVAHVYDVGSFEPRAQFSYSGEGWGLCYDGQRLVMSDGSDRLFFRNAQTFELERTINVQDEGVPIRELNELECRGNSILANVWLRDVIVHIDAQSGDVVTRIDATSLRPNETSPSAEALNGIAYDPSTDHYLLTGKNWSGMYVVELELPDISSSAAPSGAADAPPSSPGPSGAQPSGAPPPPGTQAPSATAAPPAATAAEPGARSDTTPSGSARSRTDSAGCSASGARGVGWSAGCTLLGLCLVAARRRRARP